MSWRYIATRLNGDGTEDVIAPELPLSDVEIRSTVSEPSSISGMISPEYAFLLGPDGVNLLKKWSTAIYAEEGGVLRGGGILVDDSIDPSSADLSLDVMGFSGYPNGMPYTEGDSWPPNPYPTDGLEPMDAFREIWRHLQAQTRGNLGVEIDQTNIGIKIGKMVAQGEFDTVNGPLSFEYEPFQLRWFETHDLGDEIRKIVEGTPLDFVEELSWSPDRNSIRKYIRIGYPRIGSRRLDARFVMGENVEFTDIETSDSEYADVILGLGAGEGSSMVHATAYRGNENRIRRARVFESKASKTPAAINEAAQSELRASLDVDEVTEVSVIVGHETELQGIQPGDEVRLLGETPFRPVDMWVRVSAKIYAPDTGKLSFEVARSDTL